jgi:hypothetical protein
LRHVRLLFSINSTPPSKCPSLLLSAQGEALAERVGCRWRPECRSGGAPALGGPKQLYSETGSARPDFPIPRANELLIEAVAVVSR